MPWKRPQKTKEPENFAKAYDYAMFLLSLSLRTEGEVREKMEKQGYVSAIIERVIKELLNLKYLNDQRYAEVFLENLKQYKNFGFYGIKKKFMGKKLPAQLIESVLAEGLPIQEELKIAKRLLKKVGSSVDSDEIQDEQVTYSIYNDEASKEKQKLAQKLKSRGFRGDVIAKVIR